MRMIRKLALVTMFLENWTTTGKVKARQARARENHWQSCVRRRLPALWNSWQAGEKRLSEEK